MTRDCPVCYNSDQKVVFSVDYPLDDLYILGNKQIIYACEICGMVFSDASRNQSDYDNYYLNLPDYTPNIEDNDTANQNRIAQTLNQVKAYITETTNICDLGCGSGYLLENLYKQGFKRLTGIDARLDFKQDKYKYERKLISSFDASCLSKYDFTFCIGILEHIYDLKSLIERISSNISETKYFYIEVPNASRYHEKVISPYQDFNLEHINHFSEQAIKNLAIKNDLEIIFCTTIYQAESNNYQMPVISCLLKKKPLQEALKISKDETLLQNINQYIAKSTKLLDRMNEYIDSITSKDERIYIWGVGQLCLKLCQLKVFKRLRIEACIDKSFQSKELKEYRILAPCFELNPEIPILIGSTLHAESIQNDIVNLGIKNRVIIIPPEAVLD